MKKWLIFGSALTLIATVAIIYKRKVASAFKSVVNYAFSKEQEAYLSELHPAYQDIFRKFISEVQITLPYKVLITSGYRTFAEQAELHKENPQNAASGSLHNFGMAIDINLVSKKDGSMIKKSSSDDVWRKSGVLDVAKKNGLEWGGGGKFGDYDDTVHFQIPLSGSKLYAQAIKQFGSENKIIGNQLKLT